jgi:protease secretion system membrane fusion protein
MFRKKINSSETNLSSSDVEVKGLSSQTFQRKSSISLGIYLILGSLICFIGWAALAPLDEGVPAQGTISIEMKTKTIQHQTGGIIQDIFIKEGQQVKKGDKLITLDNANSKARFEEINHKYINERIMESRLTAEQLKKSVMDLHPYIISKYDDQLVREQVINQQNLLKHRIKSLESSVMELKESIASLLEQIKGLGETEKNSTYQLEILKNQLEKIKPLVEEGYAQRIIKDELEIKIFQIRETINEAKNNRLKAERSINELKQRIQFVQEEYAKEINTKLGEIKSEVDADAEKLAALANELSRTEIFSPVDGQIVDLQFFAIGSVIQPGQKILSVVPNDEFLVIEAKIPPHLIDKVYKGLLADIRFSNFSNTPQLMVEGKVDSVSKDLIKEPNTNSLQPGSNYYLAKIIINESGLKKLKGKMLQSGMPTQIIIKTGERSLFAYLIHPFIKRISASLKEE